MPHFAGRQLPLDLASPAALGRDDLVPGRSNADALSMIDRWPDWPAPVLVLAGPAGAGKSHLAAIWRSRSGATALAADRLGDEALAAASRGPVLVEDPDAAAIDEAGLFHLLNALRSAGHHLLVTSRRFPASWPVALPDLVSRLRAAATVEIGEPDDALLAAVMIKLFADRQVEVEPHVVQFLVRRMERSLSTASALVDRLDRAALERKNRITRALAAEIVAAMDAGQAELGL